MLVEWFQQVKSLEHQRSGLGGTGQDAKQMPSDFQQAILDFLGLLQGAGTPVGRHVRIDGVEGK